ncbi:MAG: hypothetical protein ISS78_01285 [Phycisphaerae bacterium]|nr:hypothetical protein [Phycisphaerae bacterium]
MGEDKGSTRANVAGGGEIQRLKARCRDLHQANVLLSGIFDQMARRGVRLCEVLTDEERHALLAAANMTSAWGQRAGRAAQGSHGSKDGLDQ